MVRHMRTKLIAAGFAATVLAGVLTACGTETVVAPTPMPMMSSASPSPSVNTQAGDISFAQLMIAHHLQAIDMSDMALSQANSNSVKDLADQIKSAQDPEINIMRGWLSAWGAPEETNTDNMANMTTAGQGMMTTADLEMLSGLSGPSFDLLWLQMMVKHHQGAIAMATAVLATTQDPTVRTLAQNVISSQTAEIAKMKEIQANGE
jgi:uncharacterized protein (DUF305 family)